MSILCRHVVHDVRDMSPISWSVIFLAMMELYARLEIAQMRRVYCGLTGRASFR